jgi:carboxylesterase
VGVLPGAEPFTHDGGDVGVVLCHGFTGTPQSLRPWAQALADAGHSVRLPRLPGHGTAWQEMNRTTWHDWYGEVDRAFDELHRRCDAVVVAGLSMGGSLALRLAQQHGDEVAGVVLVNPCVRLEDPRLRALPVLRRVVPSLAGVGGDIKKAGSRELAYDRTPLNALYSSLQMYTVVAAELRRVTQPLLVFRSPEDHVVPASSSALVLAQVSSGDVSEVLCEDSYHVATLDHDAERIVKESLAFINRVTDPAGAGR